MSDAVELARLRLAQGGDATAVPGLSERARRAVTLAVASGADVRAGLDAVAAAEADRRRARRALDVALAQSRAVAGGLLAAPVLFVPLLGGVLDADLVGFYTQPVGWLVGGVVALLLTGGALAVVGLLRRARRALVPGPGPRPRRGTATAAALAVGWLVAWWAAPLTWLLVAGRRGPALPAEVDEVADLLATALAGGAAPAEAVREVARLRADLADALARLAFDLDQGRAVDEGLEAPLDRIAALLHTAADRGVPVEEGLRRLAADLRADDLARALAAAERLPVHLTFPTALALLPAVLLAIGAPVVHAGLAGGVVGV